MKSIATTLLLLLLASVSTGQSAMNLTSQGSIEVPAFHRGMAGTWSQGALVVMSDRFSSAPSFRMYDRSGKETSNISLTIPNAARINIYDNAFARSADGTLAVIGTASTDDNRGTTFFAAISPSGEKLIVRLSPFFPNAVTIASDGTYWIAGHQWQEGQPQDRSQNLFRRYDQNGKLLDSFLPWATVNDVPHTLAPDANSVLVSSGKRVVWYARNSRTYIEFSLDGRIVKRVQAPDIDQGTVTSLAVCDHATYIGASVLASDKRVASWGLYEISEQAKDWTFLPQAKTWGFLHGCDGNTVLSHDGPTTISLLSKPE